MAIPIAAKVAAVVLGNEKGRKTVGWIVAACLSPLILLIVFICCLGLATADHNTTALEICFYGGSIPLTMPQEYRDQIEMTQANFGRLDAAIAAAESEMEDGDGLDSIRVKAIFYALFFGRERYSERSCETFVSCFVTEEERTRMVEDEDGDEYEETYIAPVPIASLPTVYANIAAAFNIEIIANDQIAYLMQRRGIQRDVIEKFAHEKLIYESAEPSKDGSAIYHNAVFVGTDEDDVARHAHKRSLNSQGKSYRQNMSGSDARFSFHRVGESERLYVFEAPIDLLSYISLYQDDWQDHSYVALCGVGGQAILHQLEQHPHLKTPILCLDNDTAGQLATDRLTATMRERGYEAQSELPRLKDWNEVLVDRQTQTQNRSHQMTM